MKELAQESVCKNQDGWEMDDECQIQGRIG